MEEQLITIRSADWLFNCGILGLYNILTHKGNKPNVVLEKDKLLFPVSEMDGFSEKYFSYFIDVYEMTFSLYRITSFEEFLVRHQQEQFVNFTEKSLDKLNEQIESVKKYLKSNSYVSAYSLIECPFDPLKKEKELKKISLKKDEIIQNKISDVEQQVDLLLEIVAFFHQKDTRKYIGGKNTMYSIIRNAWDKVSIMNPQNKNPNMYEEMENYFVKPMLEYYQIEKEDKQKYKYRCMNCFAKIKDLSIDLGFMREMGFDVNRKTSHVWDFNNYVAICPVCRLVYACVPAGFNYLYNRGIFINYSMDLGELGRINQQIRVNIRSAADSNTVIYHALQEQMDRHINEKVEYELSDVQVIRFKRDPDKDTVKYTFNVLNRNILETVKKRKSDFDFIRKGSFSEGNDTRYIYNEVMKRLLNNENQFLLIQKLMHYKLSMPDKSRYGMSTVKSILNINITFLKEAGYMEKTEKDIIKSAKGFGHYLQKAYGFSDYTGEETSSEKGEKSVKYNKKLDGIAYRMLNALKTNNKHAFMDVLINAHMYVQKSVPPIFAEYLEKDLEFKNIGYAFITGMIGYAGNTEEEKKEGGR